MKQYYKILFLFLLLPTIAVANSWRGKHTKTKTITKEFNVSANADVILDNRYGSIDITTWNQNKVALEIKVKTNSNNEQKAQDRLDDIQILVSGSNSEVSAKTQIGKNNNSWGWFKGNNSVNIDIEYIVKMPKSNNLDVDMDYGDVMISDVDGEVSVNLDYGKLIAGNLPNNGNSINLDYSRGSSVETMGNVTINIDYSSIDITSAGDVDLNTDYSDTSIDNASNVKFNSDYGSIKLGIVNSFEGSSDYVALKADKILENLVVDADYGSLKIGELGPNFKKVSVTTDYLGVKLGVPASSSFKYQLESKYGGISVPDGVNNIKQIEKSTSKYFEGDYNGSNGNIYIKTSYGSIKIYKI
ncbi:hypothetical protein KH5_22820 [Urechidicola sp. KH5]